MTNNHLLLYRLAELMLDKQQHILSLDDLFEDEQIGSFVKSIQIDSPYQQLIFEGVLTETIKKDQLMVSFTVEGYFHYVLGEVIEKRSEGKHSKYLKELLETNKLRGVTEGIEQCLVRDVEKNNLYRLTELIDEGGKALVASSYPLAQAFLIHPIEKVMNVLLADPSDNDILAIEIAISELESSQQNYKIKSLFQYINNVVKPNNILEAKLYVRSIEHIPTKQRIKALNKITSIKIEHDNEIAGDFYFCLAEQFHFISEYDKAIDYYEKSLAIDIKIYGAEHPFTGMSYNNLGSIWKVKGEYDKAIDYYEKSLAIDIKIYGAEHPFTGMSYNNLGSIWKVKGEYDKAIDYYEKALAIRLKVHGAEHPSTGTSYNNLGSIWKVKGEYDKAIDYLEKALAICLKVHGAEHPSTGTSYNNLGSVWNEKGEYDKAIDYLEKALAIRLKVHGAEHPSTGISYNNLGSIWDDKGEYDKAIDYYEKALAIRLKVHGAEHPSTGTSYNNLGSVWNEKGEYDKAIDYLEKALAIRLKVHGAEHPSTGISYNNLGNCYRDKKQYLSAKKYYQKSYNIFLSKLGEKHQNTKFLAKKLKEINDQ